MREISAILLCLALAGCEGLFDYHPYDGDFGGETDINRHNIARIEPACRDKDTLRVAFLSDSHGWYSDTEDIVSAINARSDIDFVVHGDDLTDCGTTDEFVWQRDILQRLHAPYVAMVGNHDFLGTGEEVYARMWGEENFSFIAGRVKFVCLNTNAVEYDYVAAVPDFDYMEEQESRLRSFRQDGGVHARLSVQRPVQQQCGKGVQLLCEGIPRPAVLCESP